MEERAIMETDKKYGQFLFRIAYNILRDRLDSEECRNDTYLGVWNAIPPARPTVFRTFITQIVRRTAIDRYRAKTAEKRIPSELTLSIEELRETLHSDNVIDTEYAAKELGKIISDYVRALPDRGRYIFIDRFYLAEDVEAIAADLSVSIPTVYREIEKLKHGLKIHLERSGVYI